MTDPTTPRRAGNVGPHRESHEARLDAMMFVRGTVPVGYMVNDFTHGIEDWGMDYNGPDADNPPNFPDGLGDCGVAGYDHYGVAKAANAALIGTAGRLKFAHLYDLYWAYGVAQGEVGQPPASPDQPDEGVDNATFLGWLYRQGLIYGYGEVPVEALDYFVSQARGVLIGVAIDGQRASDDFQNHVAWGEFPGAQDGHDVLVVSTDGHGAGELITWGARQAFTPAFRRQIQDAWIIYEADDPSIDHESLQAALLAVHGTINPSQSTEAGSVSPSSPDKSAEVVLDAGHVSGTPSGSVAGAGPFSLGDPTPAPTEP